MNYSMIRYILSSVLTMEGIFLLLPCLVAAYYGEGEGLSFLIVAGVSLFIGVIGRLRKPKKNTFYAKEGFVTVTLSWILLSLVGAIPFYVSSEFPTYVDALFETISGFTTTGASVLSDVEVLAHCTLFWRCFTHWIGGMGVLVFLMAILPLTGSNNMHLMRAESPGPAVDKLVPKVKSTAMILYGIYVALTFAEVILLLLAGMPLFESVTLSFSTAGTGGFGLLNSSAASYSMSVQIILIVFMLLCAMSFNIYYLILTKRTKEALANEELRWFIGIVSVTSILIALNIKDSFATFGAAFQSALFQVSSIITTTGFASTDFNLWPQFSKMLLLVVMFIGACAGSTGGGFKISRIIILFRSIKNEIICISHPRTIKKIHMNGRVLPDSVVKAVHCYLATYVLVFIVSVVLVSLNNFDTTTTVTSVLTTLSNAGPGYEIVGPTGNFGSFSAFSKIVLMFDMLIGRLELFPLLIFLTPGLLGVSFTGSERFHFFKRNISNQYEDNE